MEEGGGEAARGISEQATGSAIRIMQRYHPFVDFIS
jgi:hypothetical protein